MKLKKIQENPTKRKYVSWIYMHSTTGALVIPSEMNDIIPPSRKGITRRPFRRVLSSSCFIKQPEECTTAIQASAADMLFGEA